MNESAKQAVRECSTGSLEGSMAFPEVVSKLAAIGCEQYHADLRRQEKTYYMPDGASHIEPLPIGSRTIAEAFSADAVVAALRAIRSQEISYVEFLRRIIDAGCIGYFVSIAGKRALYLGRNGDVYVEHFPAANARDATTPLPGTFAGHTR